MSFIAALKALQTINLKQRITCLVAMKSEVLCVCVGGGVIFLKLEKALGETIA